MIYAACSAATPSGHTCHHLAGRCPFHPVPESTPAPGPEPTAKPARPDPHRFIYDALQSVVEGRANPTVINRLVRTLAIASRLGPPPLDRDQEAEEAILLGIVMHGIPPRTEREWELARDTFTAEGLHTLATWLHSAHAPPPAWLADIPDPLARSRYRNIDFDPSDDYQVALPSHRVTTFDWLAAYETQAHRHEPLSPES